MCLRYFCVYILMKFILQNPYVYLYQSHVGALSAFLVVASILVADSDEKFN